MNANTAATSHISPQELPEGHLTSYDEERFVGFLSRHQVHILYLIHNKYWAENFRDVYDSIQKSRFYEFITRREFKGVEVYKYRVLIPR